MINANFFTWEGSKKWALNCFDFIKGAIMAIATPILFGIQELIPNWGLTQIQAIALSAFVAYLIKNLFTPASGNTEIKTFSDPKIGLPKPKP